MPTKRIAHPSGHRVPREDNPRLAQRPVRQPGVAPPCEEDKDDTYVTDRSSWHRAKVSLPEVKWLKRDDPASKK